MKIAGWLFLSERRQPFKNNLFAVFGHPTDKPFLPLWMREAVF
jgi:hypothetical protein